MPLNKLHILKQTLSSNWRPSFHFPLLKNPFFRLVPRAPFVWIYSLHWREAEKVEMDRGGGRIPEC